MFEKRSCQFKIETLWQELVNRHIQEIQVSLKEIKFFNRLKLLCAKGSIKRIIFYIDFDGRYKKVEDRLQFEVTLGESLPEPLPALAAILQQDYYLFQPKQKGESGAVLEAGFSLAVNEIFPTREVNQEQNILLDTIIEKDSAEYIIDHVIRLPRAEARPKYFKGEVSFCQDNSYVKNGKVTGFIEYLSKDNIIREFSHDIYFNIVLKITPFPQGAMLKIQGEVVDYNFHQITSCKWKLEIRISYNWRLTKKEELSCLISNSSLLNPNKNDLNIIGLVPIHQKQFNFNKHLALSFLENNITELNIKVQYYKEKLIKSGILLSVALEVEAYYIDRAANETFKNWELSFDELLNDNEFSFNEDFKIISELLVNQPHFFIQEQSLNVLFTINYLVKFYHQKLISLIESEEDGRLIVALIATAKKEINFIRENKIALKRKVIKINDVRTQLNNYIYQIKEGWLRLESELITVVDYCGVRKKVYEETFRTGFIENLPWNELTSQNIVKLEPKIVHETYELNEKKLTHQCLISLLANSFIEVETNVKIKREEFNDPKVLHNSLNCNKESNTFQVFLEQEIPLQLGNPREITEWQSFINSFNYHCAEKALFVEGKLGSDLEYWDNDGFLRKEYVEFSFWNFINTNLTSFNRRLIPKISNSLFTRINKWSWQKGVVKVTVKLELSPLEEE